MIRKLVPIFVLVAAAGMAACEEQLTIRNPNSGESERVLGTPNDAEALVSTYYKRWHSGVHITGATTTTIEGMSNILALQNYSSLANDCQNVHLPFSGATNFNNPGNACAPNQSRLYSIMGEVNRVSSTLLARMKAGLTLGSPARDARARAWAEFLNGLALGYTALMHDSGGLLPTVMRTIRPG